MCGTSARHMSGTHVPHIIRNDRWVPLEGLFAVGLRGVSRGEDISFVGPAALADIFAERRGVLDQGCEMRLEGLLEMDFRTVPPDEFASNLSKFPAVGKRACRPSTHVGQARVQDPCEAMPLDLQSCARRWRPWIPWARLIINGRPPL